MLNFPADEFIVTNHTLARIGENSSKGWEIMNSHVWWLGKEVACMCDASVLEDSLSPLHGKFFALYSNTAAETLYPDSDTSCVLWNLKSPLQMPEQVLCVCVNPHSCTKRCLLVAFGLAWLTKASCPLAVPLFFSCDSSTHGSIRRNAGPNISVF